MRARPRRRCWGHRPRRPARRIDEAHASMTLLVVSRIATTPTQSADDLMLLVRHPARGVLGTARTGSPPRDAPAARPGLAVGCEQPRKAASSVTATGWSPTASAIPRPATSCRHRASHGSGAQRPDEFVRLLLRQLATALRGRCPPISRVPSGQVVLLAASAAKQFAAFRLLSLIHI